MGFYYVPSTERARLAKISDPLYQFLKDHTVRAPRKERIKYEQLLKEGKPVFKSFEEGSNIIFQEWLTNVYKHQKRKR